MQRQASIPHSKPTLGKEEAAAAAEVVRSGYLAEGQRTVALETTLAETIGVKHAAAVNSGSSALHLALLALDVAEGDEVVVPSYVCTAVLNAVNYVGATPVLADVDDSLNLCPHDAKRRLSRKTKAVIVPHLLGNPAAIDELAELGPPIIEDCAQAIGATVPGGPPAQAGARGVLSVFSFYATKVLAAGECGAVASNSARLIGKVVDLKDYDERRSYRVRYNYKCNDLAAALALCQLRKLPRFLTRRRAIARQYAAECCRARTRSSRRPVSGLSRSRRDGPPRSQPVFRSVGSAPDAPSSSRSIGIWASAASPGRNGPGEAPSPAHLPRPPQFRA